MLFGLVNLNHLELYLDKNNLYKLSRSLEILISSILNLEKLKILKLSFCDNNLKIFPS